MYDEGEATAYAEAPWKDDRPRKNVPDSPTDHKRRHRVYGPATRDIDRANEEWARGEGKKPAKPAEAQPESPAAGDDAPADQPGSEVTSKEQHMMSGANAQENKESHVTAAITSTVAGAKKVLRRARSGVRPSVREVIDREQVQAADNTPTAAESEASHAKSNELEELSEVILERSPPNPPPTPQGHEGSDRSGVSPTQRVAGASQSDVTSLDTSLDSPRPSTTNRRAEESRAIMTALQDFDLPGPSNGHAIPPIARPTIARIDDREHEEAAPLQETNEDSSTAPVLPSIPQITIEPPHHIPPLDETGRPAVSLPRSPTSGDLVTLEIQAASTEPQSSVSAEVEHELVESYVHGSSEESE